MAYVYDDYIYQQKTRRKTGGFFALIILVILLFCLAVFLIPKRKEKLNFYFVELGNFLNYNQACKLNDEIISKQGAGYIYFDGSYHVLANFYYKKDDAQKVCENLKSDYQNAQVFTIELDNFKKIKSNKILSAFYFATDNFLNQLSISNINYDNGQDSVRVYSTNLKIIGERYKSEIDDFLKNFSDKQHYNIIKNCNEILSRIDEFDKMFSLNNFSQQIKYNSIDIVIKCYQIFAEF